MTPMPQPSAIRELDPEDIALNSEQWLNADTPWVARGLSKDWPVVGAAEQGDTFQTCIGACSCVGPSVRLQKQLLGTSVSLGAMGSLKAGAQELQE